jgi:PIN domain nuclease of toxin-antitoxin system
VIVLDTHVWLWWLNAPRKLSRAASRAIERADAIGVSTMSILELGDLVERRGVELGSPLRAWVRAAFAQERVEPLPLTAAVAIDAAQLRFDGDPADRVIYATARATDAQLVTRDERLRSFDPELTVW